MSITVKKKIQRCLNRLSFKHYGAMRYSSRSPESSHDFAELCEDGFTVRESPLYRITLPYTEAQLLVGLDTDTASSELLAIPTENE